MKLAHLPTKASPHPLRVGGGGLDSTTVIASPLKFLRSLRHSDFYKSFPWTAQKYYLQSTARELINNNRLSACMRVISPHCKTVDIHRHEQAKVAHFRNLCRCGNVWLCPVCSATISIRRRRQLATWLANTKLIPYMVTMTISHLKHNPLSEVLGTLLSAYRLFTAGAPYRRIQDRHTIAGTIKTLETTYGVNGWHPHLHLLVMCREEVDHLAMGDDLGARWRSSVAKRGGYTNTKKAFDVRETDDSVNEYISKWGRLPKTANWSAADEMTRHHVKNAKNGGLVPLQLLQGAGDLSICAKHMHRAGILWVEYATEFLGKHQLQFSRGIKAELEAVDPATDEQIVEAEGEDYPLFVQIEHKLWQVIVRARARGKILELAEEGNIQKFWSYVTDLQRQEIHNV